MKKAAQILNGYLPGKLAANPWVLLGLTPLILYFSLEAYFPGATDDLPYAVTVIVIAHLATSFSVVLLNLLLTKVLKVRNMLLLIGTYLLGGLMDSLVLILGFNVKWNPLGSGVSAWSIITASSLVTAAWLLMGHLAMGLLISNAQNYAELQTRNAELLRLTNSAQLELTGYRQTLEGEIASRIQRVLDRIAEQLNRISERTNPELILEAAAQVRELTENDVRALSHELSAASADEIAVSERRRRISWRGFAKFGGDASANIPWVISVGFLQAVSLALAIGEIQTLLAVVLALAIGIPVLVLVDRARKKIVKGWPTVIQILSAPIEYVVLAVIGAQIVRAVTLDFPNIQANIDKFLVAVPIGAISIWLMIFLIRGVSATIEIRNRDLAKVQIELSAALDKLRVELASVRNRLSKILHGSVQGRLASVSLALTASANSKSDASELLTQAKSQLDLAKQDLQDAFSNNTATQNFDEQFDELVSGWRGLVVTEIDLPTEVRQLLNRNSILGVKVIEAMQECITNAVRHGSANQIAIAFSSDEVSLDMRASNQGELEPTQFTPGLGWRQLEAGANSIEMNNLDGNFEVRLAWLL